MKNLPEGVLHPQVEGSLTFTDDGIGDEENMDKAQGFRLLADPVEQRERLIILFVYPNDDDSRGPTLPA
jgi:hypothetical protein